MKAVIFDMDGVISDTQRLHASVESSILMEYNVALSPEEITRRFAGVSDHEMLSKIFSEAEKAAPPVSEFAKIKWGRMLQPQPGEIAAISGTLEFIKVLQERKIPMAVASASSLAFIQLVLSTLDIENVFGSITSSDEVERGKPAPDIFLLAAKRLGMEPEVCVVIEDGVSGMIGAKAAGMKCIGLLTHLAAEESPADVSVHSLMDLDLTTVGL